MSISPLILALALAVPLRAAEMSSEARAVLEASLEAPEVAYEGQITVVTRHQGRTKEKTLAVTFAPPDQYRREVVDRYGIPVMTIVSDGEEEWIYDRRRATAWKGEPADRDFKLQDPDEEMRLLERNYTFRLKGSETVAGRDCRILEVRSVAGGRLVRRLWVDRRYGLVLQRKTYLRDGSEASSMRFFSIDLPANESDWDFTFFPPAGVKTEHNRLRPDYLEFDEAAEATAMRPMVPEWLPRGYLFESLNILPYKGATILHYRYTDGMDVLSLFQSPRRARVRFQGALTQAGKTAQNLVVSGGRARLTLTAEGKFLEWWGEDHFVLVGRLGADAMRRVAQSLAAVGSREAP